MKKIISLLICVFFTVSLSNAQEVFLSLTKYSEDMDKLPTNVTVIGTDTIESRNVETLGELIQHETGISFRTYGTTGAATSVSIRGASSLQTLVLVDGRRVNDISLGSADFTSFPVDNIERIEIIRGAGSAIYGTSAFGGVINVITKKASSDSPVLDTSISYGSFNNLNTSLTGAYATDSVSALVTSSMLSSDGERENSAFNNHNIFFNASFNFDSRSTLSLSGNIYESVFGTPGSLTYPSANSEQKDSNKYLKADYDLELGKGVLSLNAYTSKNIRKYSDPDWATKDRHTSDTFGFQADFVWDNMVLAGAEWWQEDYKKEDLFSDSTLINNDRKNTAVYTQLNLDIWKFTIIPSLRGDSNSTYGEILTPAISAIYNLNEKIKISANTGRVWRAPSFSELYDDYPAWFLFANKNLKPEHGISSDIGLEYSHGKVRFMGSGFYINSRDLIKYDADPITYVSTLKNIDKAKQYGAELEAGYIMTSWMDHKINYTYLKAEDGKTGKILTYSPEHTLNYTLTIKPIEGLSIASIFSYKDKQKTGSFSPDLDAYFTVDLNANYKISENLSVWLKGYNITDEDYQMAYDYPMPGVTVYGGVGLKFWK